MRKQLRQINHLAELLPPLAAALVAVGLHTLGFTAKSFALTNVVFVLVWLGLDFGISRGHKALSEEDDEASGKEASTA